MSNDKSATNLTNSSTSSMSIIPSVIQFWLYFIFLIPSLICTLFVLYYLLFDRTLRRALNNHVIIVLLITVLCCEVTMYPWMLYYYYHVNNWQRSFIFCSIWGYIDWAFYVMQIALFAWASIERHIFIFHDSWIGTRKKRFFIHYLPIIIIVIYYLMFYLIIYFFPFCENTYLNIEMICISICSFNSIGFHIFETIINNMIPSLTIVIFSISLLLRIFRQKQRMRQAIQWRKHRKMTIQLISIAFLYLIVTFPSGFMTFLRICGLSNDVGIDFEYSAIFLSYYIVLFFPFVTLFTIPELSTKIKTILKLQRPRRLIAPEILLLQTIRKKPEILATIY